LLSAYSTYQGTELASRQCQAKDITAVRDQKPLPRKCNRATSAAATGTPEAGIWVIAETKLGYLNHIQYHPNPLAN
jgi:hypothetical protein